MNIPLRGIAIGNGWIDANNQYLGYLDYVVKVGLVEENTDVRFFPRLHIHLMSSTGLEKSEATGGWLHCFNREERHELHGQGGMCGHPTFHHGSQRTKVGRSFLFS